MNRRHLVLGAALVLTLGATWWASTVDDDDALVADRFAERPRPTASQAARVTSTAIALDLGALAAPRTRFAAEAPTIFGRPAPVAAPVIRRPPPAPVARTPVAPPVPYTYIGSLKEEGQRAVVFLMRGQAFLSARVGHVIDKNYRVQSVDETGVTLVYLPLGQTQRIELADRS